MGKKDRKIQKHLQNQMGCMSGFLHIFDRHQLFPGKRIYTVKTLPSPKSTEPETNGNSPAESESTPETTQTPQPEKPSQPVHRVFDFKEGTRSPWKFTREAPRLSLDSRAVIDAKGTIQIHSKDEEKRRRSTSTSVVAKLMGLEDSDPNPKLQKSASESRAHRDLSQQQQYRFFDSTNFQLKQFENASSFSSLNNSVSDLNMKTEQVRGITTKQRKIFYDSADFFPGPKQSTVSVSVQGEIEKRLKMRGIHEPSKDLDTLKQILEALQLKGLLHTKKLTNHRNFVIENVNDSHSPIVVMKPGRSINRTGSSWTGYDSPPPASTFRSKVKTRPDHIQSQIKNRNNVNSPTRTPNCVRKVTSSRNEPDRKTPNRSPKMRKKTVTEDESSTVSDSSSHTDTERLIKEQYREGKELLQRCDKLLNSIAEITELQQPSPVSVLDSSFYKDDSSCSPSPVMKRCIEYKDLGAESEDETWSVATLYCNDAKSEDCDFIYISEVLRASNYLPEDNDMFLLLEQQQYLKGNDTSKVSTLQRRLIFDTIHEILNRKRRLPPWKLEITPSLNLIWSEFRRIQEREESEDMFEVICGVLRKDMCGENEWGECDVEIGDVVLAVERFIFKDLIEETIRDLALCNKVPRNKVSMLRRKLEF
ncbi:unnamed protein product [Trifolium pratense]|uniref:Uncharacterized protein n=2 Tax=Trifolium pratense TaxID=57577 RepID=A0ACB0IKW0_TRIPR|nr:unnamed protein product [Trifolium pratense]